MLNLMFGLLVACKSRQIKQLSTLTVVVLLSLVVQSVAVTFAKTSTPPVVEAAKSAVTTATIKTPPATTPPATTPNLMSPQPLNAPAGLPVKVAPVVSTPPVVPAQAATPSATPPTAPAGQAAPLNGQVTQTQLPAAATPVAPIVVPPVAQTLDLTVPKNMLQVIQGEAPLDNPLLKKQAHAMALTLTNQTPDYLEVLQVEVINALDPQAVANEEAMASQRKRALGAGLLRIAASAIPYAGYGSWGAYQAAAIGSNVISQSASMVGNSGPTGGGVMAGYQQRVNNVLVMPKDKMQFQALVPKGQPAQLRVTFKNVQTNQIFSYQL
jgi:hypothetical protein